MSKICKNYFRICLIIENVILKQLKKTVFGIICYLPNFVLRFTFKLLMVFVHKLFKKWTFY